MSARVWFARDTGFTADPKVQHLGDEHGAGGPLAFEEMLALAKLKNNGGTMSISYASLGRRAFITAAKAKRIVADASATGLIELSDEDAKGFTAHILKWSRWQPKDPTAAARKSRERDAKRHAEVTQ